MLPSNLDKYPIIYFMIYKYKYQIYKHPDGH